MADYIGIDIEADPQDIAAEVIDFIQTRWPDWTAADGNLETWMIDGFARIASELRELAIDVPAEIFKLFGERVVGIAPIAASPATADTTWTAVNDDGYTIPAGTLVGLTSIDGDLSLGFETVADGVIAQGDTEVTIGIRALSAGEEGNGATGPPNLIDALLYVEANGITLDSVPAGGVEDETGADYMDRLASELQLLSPRPILPRDFEVLAKRITGVSRAVAIDGYNPVGATYNNERMVAVACVDEDGIAVGSGVKTAVDNYLTSLREINFVVNVIDPTVTDIDVTTTVECYATFDPADVDAAVTEALEDYFSPVNWARPPFGDSDQWVFKNKVYFQDVVTLINNVPGVARYTALTVEGAGVDVTLSGAAPITHAGTIAVTAVAP